MRTHPRVLLCLLLSWGIGFADEDAGSAPSAEITVEELTAHVRYLAGDELEGRRSGTAGGEKAAGFARDQQVDGSDQRPRSEA